MSATEPSDRAGVEARSVTTLELFFDLVFVFTITQLTQVADADFSWSAMWHVTVMLGLIFWMYDGYAFLTNTVDAGARRPKVLLLGGMGAYLVLSIAIPHAFSGTGLTFGIAYLIINAIHAFLYLTEASEGSRRAIRTIAPWNIATATAVLIGGAVGGETQELIWTAVPLAQWLSTRPGAEFEIEPAHFVERHGLLVLIAVGESVAAAGVGAGRHATIDLGLLIAALLGLAVSSVLAMVYFAGGQERFEEAFRDMQGQRRVHVALFGFGYAHMGMLLGVILTAVGIRQALVDPGAHLSFAEAASFTGGVVIFIASDGWFKSALGLLKPVRLLPSVLVLLAIPVATEVSASAGLAAGALLGSGVLWLEGLQ